MKQRNFLLWPLLLLTLAFITDTSAQVPTIKVEVRTLKQLGPGRDEAMPRVRVRFGDTEVTTDERGRGIVMLSPDDYAAKVTAPCPVNLISVSGGTIEHFGSVSTPFFKISGPAGQTGRVNFLFRCDADVTPGMVRVKIATRTSCTDDPNGAVQLQPGVRVRLGDKEYVSNEQGVIDVEVAPGDYSVGAVWQDSSFGYVAQNGIRQRGGEGGNTRIRLTDKAETLEVRMLTCGADGREKVRAEITEISSSGGIDVARSNASGKGFVGMQLRDGDTVTVRGVAKFKWLGRGTIKFDEPTGVTVIRVGPDAAPTGSTVRYRPGFIGFIKGAATFFLPPDPDADAPRDENGNIIKFRIWGKNAKIFIKGTTFTLTHDEAPQKMTVAVAEGVVEVEPNFEGQRPFELTAGGRAEISPNGVNNATAQTGPVVKTSKPVYAPGENIHVDYSNPKASGWDWVVLVQPSKIQLANGPHQSVTSCNNNPCHAVAIDLNNNSLREVNNRASFPPLPEGDYEARYVSWDGGNNIPKAAFPFKVGNPPPGPPPPVTPPQQPPPVTPPTLPPSPSNDLTGLWRNPGSNVTYRLRQIGSRLYWGADGVPMMSFANIYYGDIKGNTVDGIWIDLPGSPYVGDGKIYLRIESDCRLVKTAEVNHYASEIWVRKNSPCDGGPVGPAPTNDLTGLWKNPGGDATYRFRQIGSKLHWGMDGVPLKSFANKFEGDVNGNVIEGKWVDLPGSPIVADGTLFLKVESECRIVKTGEVNHYRAQVWVKQGSICDVTGMQQKSNTAESTKTNPPPTGNDRVVVSDPFAKNPGNTTTGTTNKPKPKVEEIPDEVIERRPTGETVSKITGKPNKPVPKVEEIPEGETISKITGKPNKPKPKVEEIPDTEITVAKNDSDTGVFINETTPKDEQTPPVKQQPKQEKPAKPKRTGPSIWEKLGTAINTAVTPQPPPTTQQPPPTGGGTTQQPKKPDGTCQGGSYWIGAPATTPTSGFQIAWSSPFGADRHHFRTFRAGTNQFVGDNDQPQNENACGRSWHFYLPAGQYDVYLYPGTFANTRNTNTGPVAGPVRINVTP